MLLQPVMAATLTDSLGLRQGRGAATGGLGGGNPGTRGRSTLQVAEVLTYADSARAACDVPSHHNSMLWASSKAVANYLGTFLTSVLSTQRNLYSSGIKATLQRRLSWMSSPQKGQPSRGDGAPNLSRFLAPASQGELRRAHHMADLSNAAYSVGGLTNAKLAQQCGMSLVATSAQPVAGPALTVQRSGPSSEMLAASNIVPFTGSVRHSRSAVIAHAYEAMQVIDCAPASTVQNAPGLEQASFMSSLQHAAPHVGVDELSQAPLVATETEIARKTVGVALAVAETDKKSAQQLSQRPVEWFVCDDHSRRVRYFVLQGSVSVEHWRINLQIDPVVFEHPDLGVKIHRGVYQAALALYDEFLPLIQDHLNRCPGARIGFTGHSLGGSLGTVLMLLYVHRGVLPASAVAPVFTFGAPAVFCAASTTTCNEDSCAVCHMPSTRGCIRSDSRASTPVSPGGLEAGCQSPLQAYLQKSYSSHTEAPDNLNIWGAVHGGAPAAAGPQGVLSAFGLPEEAVQNIIMHKDIVPRAFVCDYTVVADILKSWMPTFKEHTGLAPNQHHKVLYNFVGKVEVLQPHGDLDFVRGDDSHAMLPDAAGLYKLGRPTAAQLLEDGAASVSQGSEPDGLELEDAVLMFMNSPHPLSTLADPKAYGHFGTISRFHNPANYTKALAAFLN